MAKTSHMFLAWLLFLELAITGLGTFADARLGERRALIEPISTPFNLSRNSAWTRFRYFHRPSPNVASPMNLSGGYAVPVDSPFNLSGGYAARVDSPFNLSGGYAAPVVDSPFNLSGGYAAPVDSPFNFSGGYAARVDSPFNLSGGYAAPVDSPFNLSGGYAASVDSPFNLSGGYVAPLNLSGNSVGGLFHYSRVRSRNVASRLNLSGNSIPIGSPGFAVFNNLTQVISAACYNDAVGHSSGWVTTVAPGGGHSWDLDTVDPKNPHVLYKCDWIVEDTERMISHEAWVDEENRNRLPFYCEFCRWKVSTDGLYLLDTNWKTWTKVSNWS